MKIKKLFSLIVFLGVICSTILIKTSGTYAANESSNMEIGVTSYEMPTKNNYNYEDLEPVDKMSFGAKSIGKLYINGKDITEETYNGRLAYGISGTASFTYTFDNSVVGAPDDQWHLIDDKSKKVIGRKLDSNILGGVLFVEKSSDGIEYSDVLSPVCDFFNTNTSGVELYKASGDDLSKGTYYRFTLAYETSIADGKVLWIDKHDKLRHVEVYDFFVAENSGIISIHNLTKDEEKIDYDEYSQELMKHGETLEDGSVTRDGFEIEKFTSSYTVTLQKNSESAKSVKTGDKFREDGKYKITVKTKLGKQIEKTIYVFKGGSDKGYATYFGTGPVQAERVFRDDQTPTYARGGMLIFPKIDETVPALYGTVENETTGETLLTLTGQRNEQKASLLPGKYTVELYNGNKNKPGSIYHYSFRFTVINEESSPYVNYHELMGTQQLEDLQSKHYEVAYETTKGGYVYVCFSMDSYDQALEYAREIEGRFVEPASEGGFYYKAAENPNIKRKYYDKIELTRVSDIYAKKNVEISYINPLDKFTYDKTYDDDFLECLEDINVSESIKVFPSQEEKDKMIQRAPYLNNFTFVQVSDYDVVDVKAKNKNNGEIVDIKLSTPVKDQLKESSVYNITETNKYGKTKSYDATYLNECTTVSKWIVKSGNEESEVTVSADGITGQDDSTIEADSAYVEEADNTYDPWAIVTIKAPDVYSFEIKCLASEFKDLEFTKGGEYEIEFVDRLGNSYKLNLIISGNKDFKDKNSFTSSYTEFYNHIYTNAEDEREDYTDLEVLNAEKEELQRQQDEELEVNEEADSIEESSEQESESVSNDNGYEQKDKNTEVKGQRKGILPGIVVLIVVFVTGIIVIKKNKSKKNTDEKKEEAKENEEDK